MTPWGKLKNLEVEITDLIVNEGEPSADSIAELRRIISECSKLPDADEAICFHGARSILAQFDGDYDTAISHREIEAQKIGRLYELEKQHPTEGWALQNFHVSDIEKRATLLKQLKQKRSGQGSGGNGGQRL